MHRTRIQSAIRALMFAIGLLGGGGPAFAAAPTITAFVPASGTIDTVVTLAGSGFTGATAVRFAGVAGTFKVKSDTKLTVTVPATVAAGVISVVTPGGTATSARRFTVTPGAKLSIASSTPLANLSVAGAGFHPSTALDVYFDTTDIALTVSTAKGLVSAQFQIPASAQPGPHWVSLVERGTYVAAQQPFSVNTDWRMSGFIPQGRGDNPYENTIGTSNVSSLTDSWSGTAGGLGNPSPFVVFDGTAFVGDFYGDIHAFSSTGALQWTASTGSSLQSVTPVASAGRVFFGAANGNVYAYKATCRTDGGVCAPLWTQSVGTNVTGSLTLYGGNLYAPSNDGSIHVLNPATGAAGTPISAFNTTNGAVTTPPAFAIDGTFYYGTGKVFQYRRPSGSAGSATYVGTVSPVAVNNGAAYYTTGDGKIREFGGANWSANTSGTNCAPAPAIANNIVYAGGCTTLAAFEAGRGTPIWSVTTPGPVVGLSVANGVLYGCVNLGSGSGGSVVAYTASNGGVLWTGGFCNGPPIVVNGTVYAALAEITAYQLPGVFPTLAAAKPAAGKLRPNFRLLPRAFLINPATAPAE